VSSAAAHQHRSVVTLKPLNRPAIRIEDQPLGNFIGPRRKQHSQYDVVGRTGAIFGEELLDKPSQAMNNFVDEAEMQSVMHRFGARPISGARLSGQLVQKAVHEPRLVDQGELGEVLDFGFEVHNRAPTRIPRGARPEAGLRGEEVDRLGRRNRLDILRLEPEQAHTRHDLFLELRIVQFARNHPAHRHFSGGGNGELQHHFAL
jgi:hypothetical protein